MEPDLHIFPRSPAGLQRTHARDHSVGPAQSAGGGERIPGRGGRHRISKYYYSLLLIICVFSCCYHMGDFPDWTVNRIIPSSVMSYLKHLIYCIFCIIICFSSTSLKICYTYLHFTTIFKSRIFISFFFLSVCFSNGLEHNISLHCTHETSASQSSGQKGCEMINGTEKKELAFY